MTTSMLAFGFLLGLRHALEADHVAAVAALSTRSSSKLAMLRLAATWGAGHMLTLLVLGSAAVLASVRLPAGTEAFAERAVGVVLVLLGLDVLRRVALRRVHLHVHEHDGNVPHLHLHVHEHQQLHAHDHLHAGDNLGRALAMGTLHGLGGSGALLLLLPLSSSSPLGTLGCLALCGAGSVAGMMLFSAALFVPLREASRNARLMAGLESALGVMTVFVGGSILVG